MGYVATTFTAGEQPTTAKWNQLGSNDASFADGTGIGAITHGATTLVRNSYKFRVYRTSALTLSTGANVITFDTKSFDTGSNVDVVTNKGRFTAPIAGFYFFTGTMSITQGSPYTYNALLYKNGSNISQGQGNVSANSNSGQYIVSDFIQLAANDYVEMYGSTSNPGGMGVNVGSATTYFSGFYVSST